MSTTNILEAGDTAATSDQFTVTAGVPATVTLIGDAAADVNARPMLQRIGSDSSAYDVGLYDPRLPIIDGAGTYQLVRAAGLSYGIDVS